MHAIMVAPLPAGCRLTAIFDVSLPRVQKDRVLIAICSPATLDLLWVRRTIDIA
jgi:hypothetical protein